MDTFLIEVEVERQDDELVMIELIVDLLNSLKANPDDVSDNMKLLL